MSDPVHFDEKERAWFFYEETWAHRQGPFKTQEEATQACKKYAHELDGVQLMTIAEFRDACRVGAYNDDDGSGYLGTIDKGSEAPISCSSPMTDVPVRYTHVWWYNK